mgnify:CR=1 FL=1
MSPATFYSSCHTIECNNTRNKNELALNLLNSRLYGSNTKDTFTKDTLGTTDFSEIKIKEVKKLFLTNKNKKDCKSIVNETNPFPAKKCKFGAKKMEIDEILNSGKNAKRLKNYKYTTQNEQEKNKDKKVLLNCKKIGLLAELCIFCKISEKIIIKMHYFCNGIKI